MADHKLIACVGYSLRLAVRQRLNVAAGHLQHGLYALVNDNQRPKHPICLYSALGFDEEPVERSEGAESVDHPAYVPGSVSLEQPGADCCERASQTDEQMLSMTDFESFLDRLQQNLAKNLMDKFGIQADTSTCLDAHAGSSSDTLLHRMDQQVDMDTQRPPNPSSSSSLVPGTRENQNRTGQLENISRAEAKRLRREFRRQELAWIAGNGQL